MSVIRTGLGSRRVPYPHRLLPLSFVIRTGLGTLSNVPPAPVAPSLNLSSAPVLVPCVSATRTGCALPRSSSAPVSAPSCLPPAPVTPSLVYYPASCPPIRTGCALHRVPRTGSTPGTGREWGNSYHTQTVSHGSRRPYDNHYVANENESVVSSDVWRTPGSTGESERGEGRRDPVGRAEPSWVYRPSDGQGLVSRATREGPSATQKHVGERPVPDTEYERVIRGKYLVKYVRYMEKSVMMG